MYDVVKSIYLKGKIDESGLDNAILRGWITEEQKMEIMESKQLVNVENNDIESV